LKNVVGWGCPLKTIVTAKNIGGYGLSFNVTLYAKRLLFGTDNIHLYGCDHGQNNGWGLSASAITSPGPKLTVNEGDTVNLTLTSVDDQTHNFFVDYNADHIPDQGEPESPDFPSPASGYVPTINYKFTTNRVGTFTYYCYYDEKIMNGTFIVLPTLTQTMAIGNQSISLISGASGNLTYIWKTSGPDDIGYYNLTAYAWPVPGETDLSDNNFTCGYRVTVTIPGDVNGDGHVGSADLALILAYWQEKAPPAPANADIVGNGVIGSADLALILANWGESVTL
jgi:plastocyanin